MKRQQSKNELMVIDNVDLVDYYNQNISVLGAKFTPISESHNAGLCPFHVDTDPSLHYWKQKKIYHCFGCGFGGDVVKTHRALRRKYYNENLSIEKTVEILARMYGIDLDKEEGFVVKSVFDRARENLLSRETYQIPKNVLTIAEFKKLNDGVIASGMPVTGKVSNYQHLDLVASVMTMDV